MAKAGKSSYEVGFGRPPVSTQFRPGQSGNPAGRPRSAKNFATAIEEELQSRVTITEHGKRKRISKREVIAKHLVNKAASGDLKAIPLLLNETRAREGDSENAGADQVFNTVEDQNVLNSMIQRFRGAEPASSRRTSSQPVSKKTKRRGAKE